MENYYEVLGLQDFSKFEEIKPAYRKMAIKYHPDKHENNDLKHLSEEKFRQVNDAYDNLKTEEAKERYDRRLKHYYSNGKRSYSEPEPEPEPEENYDYEEQSYNYQEQNYNYTYEEEPHNHREDLVKCHQHPNETAIQTCPMCKKPYCSHCMSTNRYGICESCLFETRNEIKEEVKEPLIRIMIISALMTIALTGVEHISRALPLGIILIALVLNKNIIKYKWQDSFNSFIPKVIGLIIHVLTLTIKLPITLFIIYRNLYRALKSHKYFNDEPHKLAIGSVVISKLVLLGAIIFALVVNVDSTLPSFSTAASTTNDTETILHIEVDSLNEKGIKGTYIEHVKSPLIPHLPEGTYYDGSTIIIYKKDSKYYLDLSAQWKPYNGEEKTLEYTKELTDINSIKFDICNKYVQVYTSELEHKSIEDLTDLSYIDLKDNYKINIPIE